MQLIVFLGLLVGTAFAVHVDHTNVTVFTTTGVREDTRYSPFPQAGVYLNDLKFRPFIFVYPFGQKLTAVYVEGGFQGLSKYPEYIQGLQQGNKFLVAAYPWQLPHKVVSHIPGLDVVASAGHGQVDISQLAQLAAQYGTQPVVLVQERNENQLVRDEQLNEIGTVQVTHDGTVQVVRDVVVERLQDPRYGAFFNPYGFVFQGYNSAYPFNYGYEFPYYGFQAQYPGYGYPGSYPGYTFQAQYPYSGFQGQYPFYGFQGQYPSYAFQGQYPFYGFQGQYPSYGYQGQFYNYGATGKTSPTYPGYSCYQGYNGQYPGYGGPYVFPGSFGHPFGYNFVPSSYYPFVYNPFFVYGQRTQQTEGQEQTTKGYSGYQYGLYPPFTFYAQQPQYQNGYQYQGNPTNYQSYPYPQPGAKTYQYTPYQFQEYQSYQYQPYNFQQYQPYSYQQYQPYNYPQYQPFQNQYYQNYQSPYGQTYQQ